MTATDDMLAANAQYAENFSKRGKVSSPAKKVAIVACMDARIETGRLLGIEEGDAHVIRNAGGVVTDDVIRSLTISQRLLGTREIMLIHHSDCSMVTLRDDDVLDQIEAETGFRPQFALETFADVHEDVRQSIQRIKASPFVPHKDSIRGFVYDVESGRLNEVVD